MADKEWVEGLKRDYRRTSDRAGAAGRAKQLAQPPFFPSLSSAKNSSE